MIDLSNYSAIILSVVAAAVYGVVSWKLSGEVFSETKFARTILVAVAASLGIAISGSAPDIYVNSFASTMIAFVTSKVLGTIKPVTPEQKEEASVVIPAAINQITPVASAPASVEPQLAPTSTQ